MKLSALPCECHGLHNCPSLATRDATKAATVQSASPARAAPIVGRNTAPFAAPLTSADIAASITAQCKRILLSGGAK